MQRVSGGVVVPKLMMEVFTGKTTSFDGLIACYLKYIPKDVNHIVPSLLFHYLTKTFYLKVVSINGNDLTLQINKYQYDRAQGTTGSTATGGDNSGGHTHQVTHNTPDVTCANPQMVSLPAVTIIYEVA